MTCSADAELEQYDGRFELGADLDEDPEAFREMLLNAIEHGGHYDPNQMVRVSYYRLTKAVVYLIQDPGEGFSFSALPQAAVSNPADAPAAHLLYRSEHGIRAGGFGILFARKLVDEVIHNEEGNEVILVKYLTA